MKKLLTLIVLLSVTFTVDAQSCPDDNHPHMIDLGLPSGTKWACCNVDTEHPEKQSPTNYGGYYAWGETNVKDYYNLDTYVYKDGDGDGDGYSFQDIGSDIAGTKYDVAHVKWGGSWVMPSLNQIKELLNNCTYEWTTVNGVDGQKFTSRINDSSIFMPAAGLRFSGNLRLSGSYGNYWSSTQHLWESNIAYELDFSSDDSDWKYDYGGRSRGKSVRPVSR